MEHIQVGRKAVWPEGRTCHADRGCRETTRQRVSESGTRANPGWCGRQGSAGAASFPGRPEWPATPARSWLHATRRFGGIGRTRFADQWLRSSSDATGRRSPGSSRMRTGPPLACRPERPDRFLVHTRGIPIPCRRRDSGGFRGRRRSGICAVEGERPSPLPGRLCQPMPPSARVSRRPRLSGSAVDERERLRLLPLGPRGGVVHSWRTPGFGPCR